MCGGALSSIHRLNLSNSSGESVGDEAEGAEALATALTRGVLPNVRELVLDRNKIGDAGVEAIAQSVEAGALRRLNTFSAINCHLGDSGFISLVSRAALGSIHRLTILDVSYNNISSTGVRALAATVSRGGLPSVEVLDLASNQIADSGIVEFAQALKLQMGGETVSRLPQLSELRLHGNPFGDVAISALSYACTEGVLTESAVLLSVGNRRFALTSVERRRASASNARALAAGVHSSSDTRTALSPSGTWKQGSRCPALEQGARRTVNLNGLEW